MHSIPKAIRARSLVILGLLVILASLTIASGAPAASQNSPVKVELWGEVKRGDETLEVTPKLLVKPGEEIVWKVRVNNQRQSAIANVSAIGAIPPGTRFVPGSAMGDGITSVEYSVDGGKTYSAQPTVVNSDGKRLPAPVSSYTHVRLFFGAQIASGAVKLATYRTVVL